MDHEPFGYAFGAGKGADAVIAKLSRTIQATFAAQRELWNQFVLIEAAYTAVYRKTINDGSEESVLAGRRVERLSSEIESLKSDRSLSTLVKRSRVRDWRMVLKGAKEQAREIRRLARIALKPDLDVIELERRGKVKDAVRESGLWWCHSDVMLERYNVARVRAMKTGVALRPARENDVFGMLRVRWQNGLAWDALMGGGDTRAALKITGPGRSKGSVQAELTLCIESDGRDKDYLTMPIALRLPPDDCVVRNISLFQRRTGDQVRWKGAICVQQPTVQKPVSNEALPERTLESSWLTDGWLYETRIRRVRALGRYLDHVATTWADTAVDLGSVLARLEAIRESRKRKGVQFSDVRVFATIIPSACKVLEDNVKWYREMHGLRARAIRERDARYWTLARELLGRHSKLIVEKPLLVFASLGLEKPAWGRFCEILTRASRNFSCDVEIVAVKREEAEVA